MYLLIFNAFLFNIIDCGGYVTLEDDTFNFGVSRDISVSSPNYPDPVGLGKICRWAVKVF